MYGGRLAIVNGVELNFDRCLAVIFLRKYDKYDVYDKNTDYLLNEFWCIVSEKNL